MLLWVFWWCFSISCGFWGGVSFSGIFLFGQFFVVVLVGWLIFLVVIFVFEADNTGAPEDRIWKRFRNC